MAETTAEVRRDIEMTRERMSTTLAQLEQKLNVMQVVREHPWPALALALGAGVLLSGSHADVKAAAATVSATKGASSRIGTLLDDVMAQVVTGASDVFQQRVDSLVGELKQAIGAPATSGGQAHALTQRREAGQQSYASRDASTGGAWATDAGTTSAGGTTPGMSQSPVRAD
jgi:hypothetical protein